MDLFFVYWIDKQSKYRNFYDSFAYFTLNLKMTSWIFLPCKQFNTNTYPTMFSIISQSLRLSQTSLGETSVGQVINLVSQDIGRFDDTLFPLHYLWIGPLQTAAITYFLWQEIGVSSLLGTLTLFFFVPLQGAYSKKKMLTLNKRTV